MAAADNDDDLNLFRKEMENQGVTKSNRPLNRILPEQKKPRSVKASRKAALNRFLENQQHHDRAPAPAIDQTLPGDALLFIRQGLDKTTMRAFKREQIPLDESIDLHGMREQEAHRALIEFLADSQRYRWRCVQIIHGKGRNSEQPGGVLRPLTIHWLKQQPVVAAFCSASEREGGTGATNVLLFIR